MTGIFKKDHLAIGFVLGLILPGIASGISYILQQEVSILGKQDLLYIGSAALNLLLVRFFFRRNRDKAARGVVMATFICAFIFLFYKMYQ